MDKLCSLHFPLHSHSCGEAEPPKQPELGWEQGPGPDGRQVGPRCCVGTLGGDGVHYPLLRAGGAKNTGCRHLPAARWA